MSLLSRLAVSAARAYGALSSNPNAVSASYLVVAGGGGGGFNQGGGGGAGGLLTSTATLSILNTYSITVGAGGAGGPSALISGSAGGNSIVSGTGLTTVTSTGGGGGGALNTAATSGGSGGGGGGGSSNNTGGTATSGQGFAGGTSTNNNAAGGGGAGGVGGTGNGGAGGTGVASSISGASVNYAGGGGGGNSQNTGSGGTATFGGGAGGTAAGGTAGTANLGGGGGGGGNNASVGFTGGAGGSGVVIISYTSATPKFVGGTLTTSGGNQIHTFTSSGTLSPLTPVTASYLVVAGGGGGGYASGGGGGGAGGLLTSSTTLYSGATYVVTVGAGGAGATSAGNGTSGVASSISGTGITTVTSTGGGGAGGNGAVGLTGGSGGGGSGSAVGGSATSGQGNTGGTAVSNAGGGGGGAGAVGGNGNGVVGGNGGAGSASSISGSSVTYAGGGGGASGSSGGSGGGGAPSTNGTANTGGGGGGWNGTGVGGTGGSGTVIISYAGSQVFNGGLVTSSGGNTIHTFNATGALTPLTNNLNNSLRFRASASASLTRTMSASGTITTWSMWVKRGTLGTTQALVGFSYSGTTSFGMQFNSDNTLNLYNYSSGFTLNLTTTQVFRDPSAWYHLVFTIDTTQATAANRAKIYVNGNQVTAFGTATYPSQNSSLNIGTSTSVGIGVLNQQATQYFDGYLADFNLIDGQALEPYYFGNNDAYGNWKPIKYTGMYGTNGFYLTFADTSALTTSTNAGLGKDTSGNGNFFATNNISITAGVTYDAMLDVPTNTSATVANYATLSAIDFKTTAPSNGGLTEVAGSLTFGYARATQALSSSNKTYAECTVLNNVSNTAQFDFGVATNDVDVSAIPTTGSWQMEFQTTAPRRAYSNNSLAFSIGGVLVAGDTCQIAFDMSTGNGWMGVNNVWYNSTGGTTGDPSTGANPTFTGLSGLTLFPVVRVYGQQVDLNFGQRTFTYTPPTGYVRLNTYNLPTPTILKGNLYMDATLYTGNSSTQTITNASAFKPDFVWIKDRTTTSQHTLTDSVRGVDKQLFSSLTNAEQTSATGITLFNSNGFTTGANPSPTGSTNSSPDAYVGWQWQAGQGTTSSNTSGSITSTVSVSTTAGFSVVTYTGTGSNATVGHGLGVAPKMIIVKNRTTAGTSWAVYHTSLGNTNYLLLETTNASAASITAWNNTSPTSTVFSVGTGTSVNQNTNSMLAYCWAEIAGFSKFGSYTGNGSADGPFVYTGFRPKWIMIKNTTTVGQTWFIYDSARSTYNLVTAFLQPNTSGAEAGSSVDNPIDILSNGFKIRYTNTGTNTSSDVYIFAAYAENPFKNSNAR